jgi:DNA mismatch repair protein MutS
MRQYWEIKRQHEDAILLFRLGDFYEMFYDDAKKASKILDIALTSRDKNAADPVPLCGVPHHSVSGYISKLLEEGHKIAICEQVEDPADAKGIVRREVVRVLSPGLQTDVEGLSGSETNPLISIFSDGKTFGLAWIDAGSGLFRVSHFDSSVALEDEVWRLVPREIVVADGKSGDFFQNGFAQYASQYPSTRLERLPTWAYENAQAKLQERFSVATLEGFGISDSLVIPPAAAALLYYIESANRTQLPHLQPPSPYVVDCFLNLDRATRENLDVDELIRSLNETETSMGARRLRDWIHFPLRSKVEIDRRLDVVAELSNSGEAREKMRDFLRQIYDLERLIGRIAGARANGKDLIAFRSSMIQVQGLQHLVSICESRGLQELAVQLDPHSDLLGELERGIGDDAPVSIREGGMIRDGFDPKLDELRELSRGGKRWLAELETRERGRTGISSLKVSYNRVFGYYIEVTHANQSRVPADYERKQTLTNAERYVTPELKEYETKILSAEEKICALELEIFESLRKKIAEQTRTIQSLAHAVSDLDVFCSFARAASRYKYCRPVLNEGNSLLIKAGRHPVVERFVGSEGFVPNDVNLDCTENQLMILTGPNMAGKSTIMRQVALITLMAQTGCFVPAEEATIGLVDRIFTRVGASDDLTRGRSTFMVEMSETANILRNATKNSLILLDEIGRGTSTFDGLAIAWAVAEEIHDRVGAKTIFATHYHELTDLARTKPRAKNWNVAVKEWGEKIIFLRTLSEGSVNRSYGIEVARLAGVPAPVIDRARKVLANLEKSEFDLLGNPTASGPETPQAQAQLELFHKLGDELLKELQRHDLDQLTPKQALEILYAWREKFLL